MKPNFRPLTLDLIDEGQFIEHVNSELTALQNAIAVYRRTHGEKADKAAAELIIKIKLSVQDTEFGTYGVHTSTAKKMPAAPAVVTLAREGMTEDDQPTLFIRHSGSDKNDPRQMKLATQDGRVIDQATGLPIDPTTQRPAD